MLMLLALEPDSVHTIASIARRYGISRNHLMKIASTLTQAGFVDSVRGRNGGLKLARDAAEITLGSVVRATEDNFALVECFEEKNNACVVTPACGLPVPLDEALAAFLAVLDSYTLGDVVQSSGRAGRMRRLLTVGE
jgi:Rrf2 family nitric oxide-sensitive transcriptional repressor